MVFMNKKLVVEETEIKNNASLLNMPSLSFIINSREVQRLRTRRLLIIRILSEVEEVNLLF